MNKIMSKIDELLKQVGADFDIENKKAKVTVSSNGTDIINIKIEVLEDNSAKIESEKFEEYINTLPDEFENEVEVKVNKDFPYYKIPNKENYKFAVGKYSTLFYEYKNYVIWGITAKILENFLDFIKE